MPDGEQGRLVICPTPLGNLGDMTARALDALRAADVVCAEDTRVTGRLLAAFRIEKRLERLDEATLADRAARIVERVLAGETVVYCSDAGMPGVSDPGLRLVRAAREARAPVEVLPGPTAAATAYVASGCVDPRFYFGGFFQAFRELPEKVLITIKLNTLIACGMYREDRESYIPRFFTTRKVGMMPPLKYMVKRISPESSFLPGRFFLDRAYTAKIVSTSPIAVPMSVTKMVTLMAIHICALPSICL